MLTIKPLFLSLAFGQAVAYIGRGSRRKSMSKQARLFLYGVCLAGLATAVYGGLVWNVDAPAKFCAYLLTAMLASRLKVELPEITGTISVNFLFILIGRKSN